MKKHFKSVLAALLALVLLLSALPAGASAEAAAADSAAPARATGRIHAEHAGSRSVTDAYLTAKRSGAQPKTTLPAKYNSNELGYVTAVRNQNPYGTCWAHGAMASVESYMIQHGIVSAETGAAATTAMNLSEYHLAWYNYTYAYDALNMLKGDRTKPYSAYLDLGGFGEMATYTLMRWEGPASETNPTALAYSKANKSGLGADYAYQYNIAHVTDVDWIPTANMDAVKQAIMEYGAGTFGYCHEDAYGNDDTGAYCFIQKVGYGESGFEYSNHDVTVVGWDDNYSRTKFNSISRPKKNGAWIVKNSWGSSFGDNGYYYISYEDSASLNDLCYFYRVAPVDNYDNIYQYDGTNNFANYINLGTSATIATAFVANGKEELAAAALCTWDEGVNYKLKVYTGCTTSNPASGTLAATQSGSITYQGYHTIELDNPVQLEAGQRYSIVFELSASDLNVPYDVSGSQDQYVTWTHTTHANTSFYKSGSSWKATPSNGNFRIKAYTKNGEIHTHTYETVVTEPTCTEKGYTTYTCTECGDSFVGDYVAALGHDWGEWTQTAAPSCTEKGEEAHTCKRCGVTETNELTPLGHDMVPTVVAPTCTEYGYTDYTCARCGASYREDFVDALGHAWDAGVVTIEPTEESEGEKVFTCTRCGETRTEVIPKNDHEHDYQPAVTAPTCTQEGYTTWTCTKCGASYVDNYTDALGHDWSEWTQMVAPTCTELGQEARNCARCNTVEARGIPATGHQFVDGVCIVCGAEDPDYDPGGEKPENPFDDVHDGDYYYDPVLWAVNHTPQITNGTDPGKFSPEAKCTRGQVVTFLWRAKGQPAPTLSSNPFNDVKASDYYYKAVLWAVEKEITTGTDPGKFSPNAYCTRGQVVTFLWRTEGKPEPAADGSPVQNPFGDVKDSDYYYTAVLWAVENNITQGTDPGKFSPDATCTRGQIVTFLYRDLAV